MSMKYVDPLNSSVLTQKIQDEEAIQSDATARQPNGGKVSKPFLCAILAGPSQREEKPPAWPQLHVNHLHVNMIYLRCHKAEYVE